MLIAYWITAGITALLFVAAGVSKLVRSKEALSAAGMAWVEDFESGPIKLIAVVEIVGAIGLILPVLLNVAQLLSPIAAVGLAVLMIGATVTHLRRKEPPIPAVLVALSVAVGVLGFILFH